MTAPEDNVTKLDPEHAKWLTTESAISSTVIEQAGVYSEYEAKSASKLLGRGVRYWDGHLPVLMFPYRLPFHRDPVRHRGRPLKPFENRRDDGSVTTAKYVEAKGSTVHVYFGPSLLEGRALKDVSIALWVTEGERKCLSAESHGLSCIAISGVTQWHERGARTLHPDFAHVALTGRIVYLAFDRDALTNKQVRDQEIALGRALKAAGATVYVVRFPEDAPKLDDFLARHELSELAELIADAEKHGHIEDEVLATGVPAPATEHTDLANAERFERMHGETLRFCKQTQNWYSWREKRWAIDDDDLVVRRAYRTVRTIYQEADGLADEEARGAMRAHARRSESHARVTAMIKMAGALKCFAVRLEQFDADPWLLNCENGTLDLRTGELRPHQPGDMLTKLAPVHFDPSGQHDRWDAFITHVTHDDPAVADFLARAVGYSMTGDTREDRLFFIFGPPGRGKSTFVGAVEATLGDYARTADVATFLMPLHGTGGDKPRPDLVRLAGARICVCKEIDAGAKLAEGLVKTVTGGDVITVRDLHSRPLELRPTFKLWLVANDAPTVRGDDAGMWRRILRVPFTSEFKAVETGFRDALQSEPELRTAVLAWAVAGVRSWLQIGLAVPEVIEQSTAEYHSEMDPVGEFFDRQCVFHKSAKIARKALRKAYEEWCSDVGHIALGARRFATALRERIRIEKLGEGDSDIETNLRVDIDGWRGETKWVDGWRYVRLQNEQERAVERAHKTWKKRPEVHSHGDNWGSRGAQEVVSGSFSYEAHEFTEEPYRETFSSPQSPQSPQRDIKEEGYQGKDGGGQAGDSGDIQPAGPPDSPQNGGGRRGWRL